MLTVAGFDLDGDVTDAEAMLKLVRDVVQVGLASAGPNAENVHERIVNHVEKEVIAQVLESCGGTQTKAATRLGINRNTLHKKLKDYNLDAASE